MTRMCDLNGDLVEEILTRVPITSLRAVRSTCKSWDALSKDLIVGKAVAKHQFLGFMTMDSKLYSLRFDFHGILEDNYELVDISVKRIKRFKHKISKVFHCDGLVLCVLVNKDVLLAWNPYLGQTRWIEPRRYFNRYDCYALGYDNKINHKILRLNPEKYKAYEYEIYDFSSNSWRVLSVTPDWIIRRFKRGLSLKGNTYFIAEEITGESFLLCFDFTKERFGQRLPLPFQSKTSSLSSIQNVTLSCVREEQLAVLYHRIELEESLQEILEIWVTNKIEPNAVSWSKFLKVAMKLRTCRISAWLMLYKEGYNFFIDEEKKVAVVFNEDLTFIIGEGGYFKTVGVIDFPTNLMLHRMSEVFLLLVSSSYLPSLTQIKNPWQRKERYA